MENIIDDTTGGHKTRVDGTTDDTAKWVPCCRIEPVPKCLLKKMRLAQQIIERAYIKAFGSKNSSCTAATRLGELLDESEVNKRTS